MKMSNTRKIAAAVVLISVMCLFAFILHSSGNNFFSVGSTSATFDEKIVPVVIAAPGVAVLSGATVAKPLAVKESVASAADTEGTASAASKPAPLNPVIAAEVSRLSNRTTDGLVPEQLPDGMVRLDLHGHFRSVPVAVMDADGKIQVIEHGEALVEHK